MISLTTLQQALHIPGFDGMAAHATMGPQPRAMVRPSDKPGKAHAGAVLILLYHKHEQVHLVLIRRQETLTYHPGQISFPGGRHEKNETLRDTALRETFEEVGIAPAALTVLGELRPVYIPPSDFCVQPFVAWHAGVPAFTPDTAEVADIIEIPVAYFFDPAIRGEETRDAGTHTIVVPYFSIKGIKVWGATAMMLCELLERLQVVMSGALKA